MTWHSATPHSRPSLASAVNTAERILASRISLSYQCMRPRSASTGLRFRTMAARILSSYSRSVRLSHSSPISSKSPHSFRA